MSSGAKRRPSSYVFSASSYLQTQKKPEISRKIELPKLQTCQYHLLDPGLSLMEHLFYRCAGYTGYSNSNSTYIKTKNENKNATGEATYGGARSGGASRLPRRFPRLRFCFRFRFDLRWIWIFRVDGLTSYAKKNRRANLPREKKVLEKTECVSNDAEGCEDSFCPKIVKIGKN